MEEKNYELVVPVGSANLDSNVFAFNKDPESGSIRIVELYRIEPNDTLTVLDFARWSESDGLVIANPVHKYVRRVDLGGTLIWMTVEEWAPYIMVSQDGLGNVNMSGFFADLVYSLQEITNFTYTLDRPPDNSWGTKQPNGSWSGMIGQLVNDEAHMAPAGFVIVEERREAIDFLEPVMQNDGRIFFRNPNRAFNWLAYFTPLVWEVWAAIVFFFLTSPVALALSARMPPEDTHANEFSLGKSYIFAFGALTFGRRWSVTPCTTSTRVVSYLITITGLMVHWHWKAGIISQLTVLKIPMPFQDLEGVLRSDYKLLIYPDGNLVTWFETSDDPLWQALWEKDLQNSIGEWPVDYDDLIELALSDDFAFLEYYEGPVPLSQAFVTCNMIATKKPLIPSRATIAIQKNFPFKRIFNYYLDLIKEKGHFNRISSYYEMPQQGKCGTGKGQPIGVNNAIAALLIFTGGLLVAGLLFLLELLAGISLRRGIGAYVQGRRKSA